MKLDDEARQGLISPHLWTPFCKAPSENIKNMFPARLNPIKENAGILQPACSDDPIFRRVAASGFTTEDWHTRNSQLLREAWRPVSDVRTRSSAKPSKTQTCEFDRKWGSFLTTLGIHGHPKSQTCMCLHMRDYSNTCCFPTSPTAVLYKKSHCHRTSGPFG